MSREIFSRYEKISIHCRLKTSRLCDTRSWIVSSLIFFASLSYSAESLIDLRPHGRLIKEYTFDDVCKEYPGHETFLIEKKNSNEILCLDKPVGVSGFCRDKNSPSAVGSRAFGRSIILDKGNKVLCEYLDSLEVSLSCKSKLIKDICFNPSMACGKIKNIYAQNLAIFHFSNPTGLRVNCQFVKNSYFSKSLL